MLKPGDTFGDYRVVRLLGQGGMGAVYLLENDEGGQLAAKILDPATAGDHEARKRFRREAELARGVKHPNLVETHDIGEDPDTGLCYILMEYVPGGSLADRIDQGPLPIDEAVRIVRQIASVLELARQKDIVHRDIKPANIMFGADGTAKLADLGIARGGSTGSETTVTKTGTLIGTPAYMAPEQMFDAHRVDSRADIYSLGVVFYEMLAGERPNKDDSAIQLMAKAMKGDPLPDVRTLRPEVSASLAQLLSMMVAPDRNARIATPGRVTDAIDEIKHGGTFSGNVQGNKGGSPKETKRRIPWKSLIPAAVLVGVAAAFAAVWLLKKPSQSDPAILAQAQSVPAVIGCDVSSHGWPGFYCGLVSAGDASPFGKDARVLPLQFKLTGEVLDKVNLLVLATPKIADDFDFDDQERKAVREFAERGGVVLALVRSTGGGSGESRGSAQGLLKSHGATLFNAPGKSRARAVLAKAFEEGGSFADPACDIFAKCSDEWSPLAVIQDDPTKVVSAVRPLGKGYLVFAHESYVCPQPDVKVVPGFPWDKVVSSRLKPVRRPDPSFAGSTLDDAPYEARSSRLRFVSSVIPAEHLRKVAKMDDLAVAYLTSRFGKDALGLHPAHNCIVGTSMSPAEPAWEKRLRDLDALDTTRVMITPEGRVIAGGWHYVFYHSLVPHWNKMSSTEIVLGMYMGDVAGDELQRQGYLTDARIGSESMIAQARKLDPDFTLYNFEGEPKSPTTPKINNKDKGKYYWGRIFAMLDDLVKERPDLFVRCREVIRGRKESKRGYDVFMADLCEAYGSDRPRRWPKE